MSDQIRNQLESLERQLHQSLSRQSEARLRELLHSEFLEIGRSGTAYSLDAIVEKLSAAEPPRIHAQDFETVVLAPTVALLTYRSAHAGDDGLLSRYALRSSLWKRGETGWQIVFHQGTPAPPFEVKPTSSRPTEP